MENPFDIRIYDKNFGLVCHLNDPESMAVTPIHNGVGTAALTLRGNHSKLSKSAQPGNRCRILYRDEFLFSGPIRRYNEEGTAKNSTATLGFDDDNRLMYTWLGWPVPTAALTAQGLAEDKITGPVETIVKTFLTRNLVTRLGVPITVVPTQGRGASNTVGLRMIPGADKLVPLIEAANLGFTFQHVGNGIQFDMYSPRVFPHQLSEAGGTITNMSYGWEAPSATRTVVGDEGTEEVRAFRSRIDTTLESTWGKHNLAEVFTSASDTTVAAELDARGDQTLVDNAPKSGLNVTLSESKHFRYGGDGLRVGDQVPFRIGGVLRQDLLRSVAIVWNKEEGPRVVPVLGNLDNSPDKKMFAVMLKIQRGLRLLQTR